MPSPGPAARQYILVKAPFATRDGGNEWMWVEVAKWSGDTIEGLLKNEPVDVPGLRGGQMVKVSQAKVFDYVRHHPDGREEGNETTKIIMRMQEARRSEHAPADEPGAATRLPAAGCGRGAGRLLDRADRRARARAGERGLKRALTTFAAARALGAVVSVAQGTQVDATPGGVGVSFAPGQALKPLNELIEQFAAIMLAASVSFGIQLMLLNIGAHHLMSYLVSGAALAWVAWRWQRGRSPRWLQSLLIGLLLVRFAVPLVAVANEGIYRAFMANDYQAALSGIEKSPTAVVDATQEAPAAQEGWKDRIERWLPKLPNLKATYDQILKSASDWAERIVKLIALFVLQTVVLPLVFLFAAWRLARAAIREPALRTSSA